MTTRAPLTLVGGALIVLAVHLPSISLAQKPTATLRVQGETGWWGREESGPGIGLAQRPASEWRFTLMPTLSIGGVDLSGRFLLTSLEDALNQTRNRLQLKLQGDNFGLALGDNYNSSNRLVAQGARIRGVTGYLRPSNDYNINAYYGRTARSTDGDIDTTSGRVIRFGRYERRVLNINAEAKPTRTLTVSGSAAIGEDRESSIDVGRRPRKVTTLGGAVRYAFPAYRAEVGMTAGRSETEISATEFDSIGLEREPAWAWRADGQITIAQQNLTAAYYSINTFYESFAAPTLISDREGFEISDQTAILEDRVRIEAGYEQYHDNVEGVDSTTLTVSRPFGTVSLILLPVVNQLRVNGGYRVSDNDLIEGHSQRIERHMTDWGVTAMRQFTIGRRSLLGVTVGWTQSDVDDRVNKSGGYMRSGGRIGLSGRFAGYSPFVSVTHYTTSYDALGRLEQEQLTGSARHRVIIGKDWEITADQRYSNTKKGDATTGERWEVGGELTRFLAGRSLALSASYSYIDFTSDARPETNFEGHSMYVRLATVGAATLLSLD